MQNKQKIIIIIAIILSLFAGYLVGILQSNNKIANLMSEHQNFKNKVDEFFPSVAELEETLFTGGVVSEIGDNFFILKKYYQSNRYPWEKQEEFEIVKVLINENTKFKKLLFDQEPIISEEGIPRTPEETASFSDIRLEDSVNISSSENIKGKNEFTAEMVEIQILPNIPSLEELPEPSL